MSLLVWLPLNGDLHNQGYSNIQPQMMGSGITYTTGKIGKAATFPNNANSCIYMPGLKLQIFSWCAWFKVLGEGSAANQRILSEGRDYGDYHGTNIWVSKNGTTLSIETHKKSLNTSIALNQWYHVALVSDENKIYLYLNGSLINSTTYTDDTLYNDSNNTFTIGKMSYSYTYTSSYFPFNGQVNDVRIYNHALSTAEVHEIAQGLVLHYKLDGPMGGSGINLLRGSNKIGNSNNYGWIQNGSFTNFSMEKLEGNIIHYKGTISNSKYIPSIATNTAIACKFGESYTYQMELKLDKDINLLTSTPMHFWAGCRTTDNITNVSCNGNLTGITYLYVQNHSGVLAANTWVKIITRITFPSSASSSDYNYPAIRAFVYGAVLSEAYTGEVNVWMRNCKIEKGIKATSWSPAPEDLDIDTSIITDSSGYGYNGKIIDTVETTSDAPRYNSSINYIDNSGGIAISTLPMHIFNNGNTIAFWIKPNNENGDRSIYCSSFSGTAYAIEKNTSNKLRVYWAGSPDKSVSSFTINDNEWQHITVVKLENKTEIKVYKNGVLIETLTGTFNDKAWSGTYRIGRDSRTDTTSYIGQMSDFRIYCTPLSDNDIKLLYSVNMKIDNFNNIHTYEIDENNYLEPRLLKTGTLKGKTFIENCVAEMPDGNSISFTPKANTDNVNSTTLGILFPYFKNCGHKLRATIELDATWTKFTAGTGGTFALFFQGPRVNIETDAVEWAGQAMITSSLSKLTSKVLESAGSEHIKVTTDINASFFDTHYGQKIGLRCNFSDGTGHIEISNVKVYIDYPSVKIHSKYIEENNIIEM